MPRLVWSLAVALAAKAGAYEYAQPSNLDSNSRSRKAVDFTNASNAGVYHSHAKNRTLVESYLRRLGALSLDIIADWTRVIEANATTIDVGALTDFVGEVIDTIGLKGFVDDVFNTYGFTAALQRALVDRNVVRNLHQAAMVVGFCLEPGDDSCVYSKKGEGGVQGPRPRIWGVLPGETQERGNRLLFWIPHWVGAAIADKLVKEGSLRRKDDGTRIPSTRAFMGDMHSYTTGRKYPDFHLIHVLHGFWWHYGSLVRPDLDKYPEDIFRSLCEPWLDPYEYNEHIHTSMFKECRHGIGHGVFYPLAARQDPSLVSVRKVRMEGTLPVSDATYCEGLRICDGAPDEKGQTAVYGANSRHGRRVANAKACCYGGLRHSIKLYSPRMPTDWECMGETDPAIQAAVRDNVPIKLSRGN